MTVHLSMKSNIEQVTKDIERKYRKQIPFAVARALTDVAKHAKEEANRQTQTKFEGGATGWTRRSFAYRRATKTQLEAETYLRADHAYMVKQIEGGTRLPKRRAILAPARGTRLNKYGNITRGKMQQMITNKQKYYAKDDAIWERYGRNGSKVRRVANYIRRAQYQAKFPFYQIVEGIIGSRSVGFKARFTMRLAEAIRTAK